MSLLQILEEATTKQEIESTLDDIQNEYPDNKLLQKQISAISRELENNNIGRAEELLDMLIDSLRQ